MKGLSSPGQIIRFVGSSGCSKAQYNIYRVDTNMWVCVSMTFPFVGPTSHGRKCMGERRGWVSVGVISRIRTEFVSWWVNLSNGQPDPWRVARAYVIFVLLATSIRILIIRFFFIWKRYQLLININKKNNIF